VCSSDLHSFPTCALPIRSKTGEISHLLPTGPLLGPSPHAKYETENINFQVNDVLVIYTDGIVESFNAYGELYDEARLEKVIKNTRNLTPKEIAYKILDDVIHFSKDGKYSDDKTLVVIKRHK
jgi:sigma-B regulation protein RsbU (phosphoserine phosphatase)